jgi:hypothetical protein
LQVGSTGKFVLAGLLLIVSLRFDNKEGLEILKYVLLKILLLKPKMR